MKWAVMAASAAIGAFVVSGPLQHFGVIPETTVGDASKAAIKYALNMSSEPAFASCGGGIRVQGNNGWGNGGGDGVPGHSNFSDRRR